MAVRQDVNNLENWVVVQELEFAISRALYGLLWTLGNHPVSMTTLGQPSILVSRSVGPTL